MADRESLRAGQIVSELSKAAEICQDGEQSDVMVSVGFHIYRISSVKVEKMMGGEKIILTAN